MTQNERKQRKREKWPKKLKIVLEWSKSIFFDAYEWLSSLSDEIKIKKIMNGNILINTSKIPELTQTAP